MDNNNNNNNTPTPTDVPPEEVPLGGSGVTDFSTKEVKRRSDGTSETTWKVSHRVGFSTCYFGFTQTKDTLSIIIMDDAYPRAPFTVNPYMYSNSIEQNIFRVHVSVGNARSGLLNTTVDPFLIANGQMYKVPSTPITFRIPNVSGGITETNYYLYSSETRTGYLIWECRRKSEDEIRPYTVTLTHYYINYEKENIGVSMTVRRIRVSDDGRLDFVVDSPQQHPTHALFFLFNEVNRTMTWKPTYCLHCANKRINERQLESSSEGGDKDRVHIPANAATSSLHGPRRNNNNNNAQRVLVSNEGKYKGNNNGNTFINKIVNYVLGKQ